MSAVLPSDIFTFEEGDDNPQTSPTATLFPPALSFPGFDESYLSPTSNTNTLSPPSSGLSHPSLSPPATSDSPNSNLSFATDEYLLNSNFASDELDMLIFPEDIKQELDLSMTYQPVAPFHMPPYLKPAIQLEVKQQPQQQINAQPPMPMGTIQPPTAPTFDGLLQQWRVDLSQNPHAQQWFMQQQNIMQQQQPMQQLHSPPQSQAQLHHQQLLQQHHQHQLHLQQQQAQQVKLEMQQTQHAHQQQQQSQQQPQQQSQPQPITQPMAPQSFQQIPPQPQSRPESTSMTALPMPPPRRSAPNAPINKPLSSSPPANVGKHNKTERRYRQKVQQAQGDLRDAVPALRVLYGTSTEEQKKTDVRAADGTVDGLGEVTRPNASAKATILIGARMYIELLQRRTTMLQRKVSELEAWRAVVSGQAELDAWRTDFDNREAVIASQQAAAQAAASINDSDDVESDEDEDEAPTRKRARTTKKKSVDSKMGMRAFAAFAVSFSLVPSASKMFKDQPAPSVGGGTSYAGEMSRGQVIGRLPLITAEHSSRLLARALPAALVPGPHTIVDWSVRLFLTIALLVILGPILERAVKRYQDKSTGAGNIVGFCRDLLQLYVGTPVPVAAEWTSLAARIVGGIVDPPPLVRWHVAVRLRQSSQDPYSLALLALMTRDTHGADHIWAEARTKCETDTPLGAVLALPLDEASRCLELVPPTFAPIAAISEQINLILLYDLYTRFFNHLVTATGNATSLHPMLANIQKSGMAGDLKSLDHEIKSILQSVPRHSTTSSLALVLLGLWGLFSGYQSPASLVSALAEEELRGAGAQLRCVSAMLELLYPGSSFPQHATGTSVSVNAEAIDNLAMTCIGFVDLLFSSSRHNSAAKGVDRLEANFRVQKEAARLRLVLTQANFVCLDEEEEDTSIRSFDSARQKLVAVLSTVGRRAAGRSTINDDDSGLEDELDEW
ncbi:hypothetical protein CspHIS471_0308060 [Cutaneotrichosporon sp. HIS471]|nr:hypothetical protein CspHIS471_0308060 [Cutaneotrichosporon sp. HIS471]